MQRDMELDGKSRKQFHEALLSAFPTPAKLKQMVSFKLNENLDAIAIGGNYSEVVFKLIEWAEAEGKVEKLLNAARSSNPGNPTLRSFDEQMRGTANVNDTPVTENSGNVFPVPKSSDFDVFLAHKTSDKPQVKAVARELKKRGIKYWLDEEQIQPGKSFQNEIQQAIYNVKSAAIFIGVNGLGQWQQDELESLNTRCVEEKIGLIPVLLPGVNEIPKNLLFLRLKQQVKFSQSIDENVALDNLEWGITGEKPHS